MKKLVVCALCAAMVMSGYERVCNADSKELVLYIMEKHVPTGSTGWF